MQYVGTISMENWNEDGLKHVFKSLDGHELYAGRETGRSGFRHYQFCMDCGGDLERYNTENSLGWHVEPCVSWNAAVNYCRKTGNYLYVGDSIEEKEWDKIRRRKPLSVWVHFTKSVLRAGDRTVTCYIDHKGSAGKSTYSYILKRRGVGMSIPRLDQSGNRMAEFITMNYDNERVIILDLPRAEKLTKEHTAVLEDVKDGNLATGKYQGTSKLIRGVKVLVFTNQNIPYDTWESLSKDRWDVHIINEDGTITDYKPPEKPKKKSGDVPR